MLKGKVKIEKALIGLNKIVDRGLVGQEKAKSLLDWYAKHGNLTPKQRSYALVLILKSTKKKKSRKVSKYSLYAIGDGEAVKLGVSVNIRGRMRTLQTGHPKKLKTLWEYYAGKDKGVAYKAEKQLHRYCKKHKIRGEWFHPDCMVVVRQFSLKDRCHTDYEQREHDWDVLGSSPL